MHVLLIEDDEKIGRFVAQGMKQEGHVVSWAKDGDEGLALAKSPSVDIAIVDVMLPGRDGLSIVRELREAQVATPVIVLSARAEVSDRVRGLEVGADDYLTKPFSFAELNARIAAVKRRAAHPPLPKELRVADLVFDPVSRRVTRGGEVVELQGKELALLEYLMRNAGRVVSKTMILEHVWDYGFDPQTNVVDVLVSRLRAKIDRDRPTRLIHTIRGVGYVLRGD